jgi:hypothetical protein
MWRGVEEWLTDLLRGIASYPQHLEGIAHFEMLEMFFPKTDQRGHTSLPQQRQHGSNG